MLNETYRAMLGHKSVIRETFMYGKQRAAEIGYENVFDYSLGNPSVPCPDKFTKAMQTLLDEPTTTDLRTLQINQGCDVAAGGLGGGAEVVLTSYYWCSAPWATGT